MVKANFDGDNYHINLNEFKELAQAFIEFCDPEEIIRVDQGKLKKNNQEITEKLKNFKKITRKALNVYYQICVGVYLGKNEFEALLLEAIEKLGKLFCKKLEKTDEKSQEKLLGKFFLFLDYTRIVLSTEIGADFSANVLEALLFVFRPKLVKHLNKDFMKTYCKKCFDSGNFQHLSKLISHHAVQQNNIFATIIYNCSRFFMQSPENYKTMSHEIIPIIVQKTQGLQKTIEEIMSLLNYFIQSPLNVYSAEFFSLILVVIEISLLAPKEIFQRSIKSLGELCLKYLTIDNSDYYIPLKLNICKKLIDLENHYKEYFPGLILILYSIFNCQLLYKRSKSLRIKDISIIARMCVLKEEETSDTYKNFILDFSFDLLKKHLNFLSTLNVFYIDPVKAYLTSLSKTSNHTYLLQKITTFLKSF